MYYNLTNYPNKDNGILTSSLLNSLHYEGVTQIRKLAKCAGDFHNSRENCAADSLILSKWSTTIGWRKFTEKILAEITSQTAGNRLSQAFCLPLL